MNRLTWLAWLTRLTRLTGVHQFKFCVAILFARCGCIFLKRRHIHVPCSFFLIPRWFCRHKCRQFLHRNCSWLIFPKKTGNETLPKATMKRRALARRTSTSTFFPISHRVRDECCFGNDSIKNDAPH
jgi:hypothetical protein